MATAAPYAYACRATQALDVRTTARAMLIRAALVHARTVAIASRPAMAVTFARAALAPVASTVNTLRLKVVL